MIARLFDTPRFHDEAFYRDREEADHINQPEHRERLICAMQNLSVVLEAHEHAWQSPFICDYGCGNGGLLGLVKKSYPTVTAYGYDMMPSNVFAARAAGLAVQLLDFVNHFDETVKPTIAVLTETLEHLVAPALMLSRLYSAHTRCVVASVPLGETPEQHYEYHLWAFDEQGFRDLFEMTGWEVVRYTQNFTGVRTQHIIATRRSTI